MAQVQAGDVIRLGPWGKTTSWDGGSFVIPNGGKFEEITVCHDVVINSITFVWKDAQGGPISKTFGGGGGISEKARFRAGEYITTIYGAYANWLQYDDIYVTAIGFTTNLGKTYGPYGHMEDQPGATARTEEFIGTREHAEIAGFFASFDGYGRNMRTYVNDYIQNIGIYIRPKI